MNGNRIILLVLGAVVLLCGTALWRQRLEMARLRSEIARLRDEQGEVQKLREENQKLRAPRLEKEGAERLRENELLRLRNEVSQLREQKRDFERAVVDVEHLKGANAALRAQFEELAADLTQRTNRVRGAVAAQRTGPWLGLNIGSLDDLRKERRLPAGVEQGVYVVGTHPGGPAQKHGIRAGDIITSVNNESVASSEELLARMNGRPAGISVFLDVYRRGETLHIGVVPVAWPE